MLDEILTVRGVTLFLQQFSLMIDVCPEPVRANDQLYAHAVSACVCLSACLHADAYPCLSKHVCLYACVCVCEQVAKTLPHESLVQMEEMYKLSDVKNSEIRMRWCMLGTPSPYQYIETTPKTTGKNQHAV